MTAPATEYAARLAEGRLSYQVAPDGTPVFPPRLVQPGTGAPLEWRDSAGRGEVWSTTTVRPRGGEPRNLALIRLDEGFRMMSRVVDVAPDAVRIGQRVHVRFDDGLPVFVPA